ncbi:hypothetical protein A3D84_04730 [Candidatus Woesebacteria bacterium RIFCSPHIGHO2_02_FULL_42_20]|uniref:Beta-lactamase class A catalytic domain-containing protein n=1 Tax=Candidatus Woesebacteria bacterium RIFCSPHIGHO2_12_FULL_41_24 TaxID=1802510 RepID=A0A1F8ASK4_9BACT|nr:MAG: hypothetical protein A2873_03760 [Candidatus Woesebacteria bacterium RIFCSPHIGHO2_01_FULL_42_80]OGM35030.1 MAG: hypothetical protein A3D84_04730 [Candidatus Woesebacteria bacterium RIFCSPHIGHO2_02_FULL_42_20]OGM54736.1 MAG: hypothetical protein A3E44_02525 [Candidatus Woesebacteria bacterium RIFCSPHIGHO2_12_FULL_41_24]OGM66583.1 MAG: hypothetical protein A2969_01320 [Candidatus Woesebacteria bacterium RIFCSPLOWO2_01_FULL_42_67]OGM70983.1 MAG: hypothetical protein A3I55_04640 [Candidatus
MNKIVAGIAIVSLAANVFMVADLLSRYPETVPQTVGYPFLAKRIFIENPNDIIINFVPLRQKLREYIAGVAEKAGIFFEYLPTGTGIGVNDREPFFRASLVKIPAVMRAYKLIEEGKLAFTDILTLEEYHLDKEYGSLWQLGAGAKVTVREAIRLAVVESDNTAYEVLNDRVNELLQAPVGEERNISDVYDYLDIPSDTDGLTLDVTPRNYSSILRSLFFSAYLTYEHSNELLTLMTQSTFTEGITGPLGEGVKAAHKFGIRKSFSDDQDVFSDCGIVYLPQRPYILCVMVKSEEEDTASRLMQEISRMVYEYLTLINPAVNQA